MTYIATYAPWVGCFALGLLFGLYLRSGDARRIPEHPSVKRPEHHLRVIEGGYEIYDWAEDQ